VHLRVVDLLLGECRVSGELVDGDAEGLEAVAEVEHHLLHERLHRGHVDDLEGVEVDLARCFVSVHADLVEHAEHGHVGLARAGGRADEHILGREHRAGVDARLHAVERLGAAKGRLGPLGDLGDGDDLLVVLEGRGLERGHVHLLVALALRAERAGRQVAPLVGHQVPTVFEGERLQVERLLADLRSGRRGWRRCEVRGAVVGGARRGEVRWRVWGGCGEGRR
jgi:hypothetical protein